MKKLLSMLLAVMMICMTMITAFAASSEDLSDFNGILEVEDERTLSSGTVYDLELTNVRANGNRWGVDDDYMDNYKVTLKVTEGKSYATAKLVKVDGEYYLRISTQEFSGRSDRDFAVELTVKGKKSPKKTWESGDIWFTILSDKNNVSDTISDNDDEITVSTNERVTVEFEDKAYKTTVWFDDVAYVNLRGYDKKHYTFYLDYEDGVTSIYRKAPEEAEMTFYNFRTATSFDTMTTVGLEAPNEEKYVYQISDNGGLTAINATLDDEGYLKFRTEKLGHYVVCTHRLNANGVAASPSDTDEAGYSTVYNRVSGSANMSKAEIEAVYKEAPAGGTAVLFVQDNTKINVADLKAVQAAYPNRALCVVNRVNGKTMYQYRMTATQAASLQDNDNDGVIALGMTQAAADTTSVFKNYFTNDVYVLGHNNIKSLGTNGYFAVDMSKTNLNRENIKFYWYDAARNYYNPIQTTYKFDNYNYVYFTAPVGYDVVMSDGALIQSK